MSIDAQEFREAILALDKNLKLGMENNRSFTEMSPEYKKQCHELLLDAAKSDNWDEIADEIAFFLFAGGSFEIIFNMLKETYNNKCVPTINNAAVKQKIFEQAVTNLNSELNNYETKRARRMALVKYENDPKQKAKEEVKQWWSLWQKNPELYKYKTTFSDAMLDKFDGILTSKKVIEDWCRIWDKDKLKK